MSEFLKITVECKTLSPTVSGSSVSAPPRDRFKRIKAVRLTSDHRAVIPFSGPLRAALELLFKRCGEKVCDTGERGSVGCGTCSVCKLLGSRVKPSRVVISEFISLKPVSHIVRRVTHSKLHRKHGAVSDLLTMEEIQEGAVFRATIRVNSPQERDISLIRSGINVINEFGLGGWRRRGRGRVHIQITNIEKISWDTYLKRGQEIANKLIKSSTD
jgi:CRISPR/Cas system CSM-associated protein Csm3 (group 7 of RAMP superfamily)